jgi:hypothetical protein
VYEYKNSKREISARRKSYQQSKAAAQNKEKKKKKEGYEHLFTAICCTDMNTYSQQYAALSVNAPAALLTIFDKSPGK